MPAITDARHQRRRDHRTDAWYNAHPPAGLALPAQCDELVIEITQPSVHPGQLFGERRQESARQAGELVRVIGDRGQVRDLLGILVVGTGFERGLSRPTEAS